MYTFKNKRYTSKKHPVLEYIFRKYYKKGGGQKVISFYLSDISEGYKKCNIPEPVSISNTILDLTRQDRGIDSRLPSSISSLGYDLRKKTGNDQNRKKYAGEFVYVGVGNSIQSWLLWPEKIKEVKINSSTIPTIIMDLIKADEGGLFSVIDYTDVFSQVLYQSKIKVHRIQNPMKWQPNEIDGLYIAEYNEKMILHPVEAKALTTQDEINLDQLKGGYNTVVKKMKQINVKADIKPIAIKMRQNGIDIAVFPINEEPIKAEKFYRVKFEPPIKSWQ